jgi:hypothetical protein
MEFKMAATAGLSLTLGPNGKNVSKRFFSWFFYADPKWSYVKTMYCSGSNLGIPINIKNTKFVKDLPMNDAQFRLNQCNSFREENISVFSHMVLC